MNSQNSQLKSVELKCLFERKSLKKVYFVLSKLFEIMNDVPEGECLYRALDHAKNIMKLKKIYMYKFWRPENEKCLKTPLDVGRFIKIVAAAIPARWEKMMRDTKFTSEKNEYKNLGIFASFESVTLFLNYPANMEEMRKWFDGILGDENEIFIKEVELRIVNE